jgi:tetratricopeptide (TPR) repeat protein
VCCDACHDSVEVIDHLTSLVDKNLIGTDLHGHELRYVMPETIRHYARDRLADSGMEALLTTRHLAYCISLAEEAEKVALTAAQREPVLRLKRERDNLRAALSRAAAPGGDVSGGLQLATSLAWFWHNHQSDREGLILFAALLARPRTDFDDAARARALSQAAFLTSTQGDYVGATAMSDECLAIGKALGDRKLVAQSLNGLGAIAFWQQNHSTSKALFEEALSIRRKLGDQAEVQKSLLWIGWAAAGRGDFVAAREALEESLGLSRDRGAWQRGEALVNLANVAYLQGDFESSRRYAEESLAISRELDLKPFIVDGLSMLGVLAHDSGDDSNGRRLLKEALTLDLEMGNRGSPGILEALGGVAVATGMPDVAAHIFGGAERLREDLRKPLPPVEHAWYERHVAAVRNVLDDAAFRRAWQEGRTVPRDDLMEYALNS